MWLRNDQLKIDYDWSIVAAYRLAAVDEALLWLGSGLWPRSCWPRQASASSIEQARVFRALSQQEGQLSGGLRAFGSRLLQAGEEHRAEGGRYGRRPPRAGKEARALR
jgi:hypothetical protein